MSATARRRGVAARGRRTFLATLGVAWAVAGASAQRPESREPFPAGGRRGTEVEIEFPGRYLYDPEDLVLEEPGLEVLEARGDERGRSAVFRLRIAGDAPLGDHPVRVRTRTGVGEMHLFHVGALEELTETEAPGSRGQNDTPDRAEAIALERTVNGVLDGRDVDCFEVDVDEGTLVRVELQAVRLGGPARDPLFIVRDPEGAVLLEADDSIFAGKDPVGSFRAGATGTYGIEIRGAVPVQTDRRTYRLHVGTFPRPTAAAPLGGRPGETLSLRLEGDPELVEQEVTLPRGGGLFAFFPESASGTAPTPLMLQVSGARTPEVEEVAAEKEGDEPLVLHHFPGVVDGIIAEPGETDRYSFRASKGDSIDFLLRARPFHSPLDGQIILRYGNGRYLGGNDDGRGTGVDSMVTFRAPDDGIYRVEVRDLMRRGGPNYAYRLFGTVGGPSRFSTRLLVPTRGGVDTIAVPRGGHAGHVIMVSRFEGEPMPACLEGLPEGVTAEMGPFRKDTPYVPVVLHAAADAPAGHGLARPRAAAGDDDEQPGFRISVPLVSGRNRQPFLSRPSPHIAVAVTDPPPYRVRALPPEVPLAIGSYLPIKVEIERDEGFDDSVRVELLWAPPGMTAGATTIAKGKTTGTLYLSARDNAVAETWPMAVRAKARVRGGTHEITSAMFDVAVAKRWIEAKPGTVRLEQGTDATLEIALEWKRPVTGPITLYWRNVPKGLSLPEVEVAPDTAKVTVAVTAAADAPKGRHRPLLRMKVPTDLGEVVHQEYGAEVRVDPRTAPAADPAASPASSTPTGGRP